MPDEAKRRHLDAVEAAREVKAAWTPPRLGVRRRLSVGLVAAALIVLPTGIALAAEGSLPGDALYPVKRVTESIRSLLDDDVVAEHRIEELEQLMASDAPAEVIADQVDRATREVDRLGSGHRLGPRLDVATAVVAADPVDTRPPEADPPTAGDPGPADPVDPVDPIDGEPVDKPAVTTGTIATIDDAPTSTTIAPARPATTTTVVDRTTTTTAPPDVSRQRVFGYVHAGPTCPVERFPPDPDCADRPVAGAVLVFFDQDDVEVARVESNRAGRFETQLPDGGYLLRPQPHDGLLGTAPAQEFKVAGEPVELDVAYDTGIR